MILAEQSFDASTICLINIIRYQSHTFFVITKTFTDAMDHNQIAVDPKFNYLRKVLEFLNAEYSIAVNSGAALELRQCVRANGRVYFDAFVCSASTVAISQVANFYDIKLDDLC